MNFDFLEQECDTPYIETTVPRRNGLWLLGGLLCLAGLVVAFKVYRQGSPVTAKAESSAVRAPAVPVSLVPQAPADLPDMSESFQHIVRDPFQASRPKQPVRSTPRAASRPPRPRTSRPTVARPRPSTTQIALVLKAIVLGPRPRAFINDTFVGEGESFALTGQPGLSGHVISIEEQVVKVKVGQKIRVLRLAANRETEKNAWRF